MALYFLLGTLTPDGQRMMHDNPNLVAAKVRTCGENEAHILGQYAVIGKPDFLIMVEADDNQVIARLSLEIGTAVGLHIETLPAVRVGMLADRGEQGDEDSANVTNTVAEKLATPGHSTLPSLSDVYGTEG
ncbi:MAG: GYD domain-containing protein [Chloroflexi bacterium]|nr:GYD domain-containing protein [Chloroflexota bacterium]